MLAGAEPEMGTFPRLQEGRLIHRMLYVHMRDLVTQYCFVGYLAVLHSCNRAKNTADCNSIDRFV